MNSKARLAYHQLAPKAFKAMLDLNAAVTGGRLSRQLVDLVFLRVSQINGCAFCIDLHWSDLVAQGFDYRRLNALAAWRETPFFDAREKAALQWAEMLTRNCGRDADDVEFDKLREHFTDAEIAELTFAIAAMNAWNRLAISLRQPVPAAETTVATVSA